ncbi:hypothetical protein B0H16DRAFT_1750668 [Mycena metata]|uniref:Uncharacterized protein n=1 Tax=Mycena metata TaxID=1033252 RepID=A0AAD7DMV7_9AGAR|nr:hypothetical protein B0H16DRAFT_1750668 [Mycena metata]
MSAPSFLSLVNAQKAVLIARLAHAVSASPSTAIPSTAPGPRNSGAARRHRQFEETRCAPSITRRSRASESEVPQLLGGTEEDTFSGVSASQRQLLGFTRATTSVLRNQCLALAITFRRLRQRQLFMYGAPGSLYFVSLPACSPRPHKSPPRNAQTSAIRRVPLYLPPSPSMPLSLRPISSPLIFPLHSSPRTNPVTQTGTHPLVSFLDLHLAPRMRRLVAREGNSATG